MSEKTFYAAVTVRRLSAVDQICDRYLAYGWTDEGPTKDEEGHMVLNFSSKTLLPEPTIRDINY